MVFHLHIHDAPANRNQGANRPWMFQPGTEPDAAYLGVSSIQVFHAEEFDGGLANTQTITVSPLLGPTYPDPLGTSFPETDQGRSVYSNDGQNGLNARRNFDCPFEFNDPASLWWPGTNPPDAPSWGYGPDLRGNLYAWGRLMYNMNFLVTHNGALDPEGRPTRIIFGIPQRGRPATDGDP